MSHSKLWCYYAAGALAALLWKFLSYYRVNRKLGKDFLQCADEWIFEKSTENAISWIATILVVWAAGVTYIGDVTFMISDWLGKIPDHPAFAALFGCVMEYVAPNGFKWLLSKTPWGSPV
jgi:hypothetical protein